MQNIFVEIERKRLKEEREKGKKSHDVCTTDPVAIVLRLQDFSLKLQSGIFGKEMKVLASWPCTQE